MLKVFEIFFIVPWNIASSLVDVNSGTQPEQFKPVQVTVGVTKTLFLRMCPIQKHEILNFLEIFSAHLGKILKVHFNLFLRILDCESEEKLI